jgi:hypothetical protein
LCLEGVMVVRIIGIGIGIMRYDGHISCHGKRSSFAKATVLNTKKIVQHRMCTYCSYVSCEGGKLSIPDHPSIS